ncbi:PE2R2 protein, partial [Upupa epops]|nr:PE2R2 protein [Upupa epops]
LGTCSVSPLVLASYHRNRTLTALAQGGHLCLYFGFAMSFFGLATMLILFAMALERCLALGRPYCYERFLSPRTGLVALPAIYTFSAAFCSLPLLGFGRFVQYCPGTWCFIQMHMDYLQHNGAAEVAGLDVAFSLLYATLLLFLILSVLLCNLSVIANLARMHRRGQKTRRLATLEQPRATGGCGRRMFSMAEEIDHLLLLSIMTITFVICSLPFTIRAYINKFSREEDSHELDLLALRFLSINSIVDPWVFAILRPPVLRLLRSVLCCQENPSSQDRRTLSPAKSKL